MERRRSKIAVIGAGAVGSSVAYSIAMRNLVSDLVIIDVNREKAEGEALDISHGLLVLGDMNVHCGSYSDIKDANIIVSPQASEESPAKQGLTLQKKNVSVIKDITRNIMKHITPALLWLFHPVDVVTHIIQQESQLPRVLFWNGYCIDSARFRWLLAKLGINVKNVHGLWQESMATANLPYGAAFTSAVWL